jgi:hypothetical protein
MYHVESVEVPQEYLDVINDQTKKDIKFFIPIEKSVIDASVEDLTKSKSQEEKEKAEENADPFSWKIQGMASTDDKDLEGEYIEPTAFDCTYFLRFGYFNDNHKQGPEHIIGVPTRATVSDKGLFVQGYLFKHHAAARGYYDLMKTLAANDHNGRRVGFSVEGKVLEQKGSNITKVFLKAIAICVSPVNTRTFAELMKSMKEENKKEDKKDSIPLSEIQEHAKVDSKHFDKISEDAKEIAEQSEELKKEDKEEFGTEKALAAGYATDQTKQDGGDALRQQDFDKDPKVLTMPPDLIKKNLQTPPEIAQYAMAKSLIKDIETIEKLLEYTRILKENNLL